jgi:chaperone BCS1
MLSRSRERFKQLLTHAKQVYLSDEHDQISIKMLDEHNDDGVWHQVATKSKRLLSTVVTEPGVKERLQREIAEFCKSGEWYASRGVPWRKGILFHGQSNFHLS